MESIDDTGMKRTVAVLECKNPITGETEDLELEPWQRTLLQNKSPLEMLAIITPWVPLDMVPMQISIVVLDDIDGRS